MDRLRRGAYYIQHMLTIRREQLAALAAAYQASGVRAMVRHIRNEAPEHADDPDLEQQVRAALARGRSLGLEDGWDLCRFALLAVVLGPRFNEEQEWACRILADESLSPSAKMDELEVMYVNYLKPEAGKP